MGGPAFDPESEAALDQAVGRRREELFARLGKDMPRCTDPGRFPAAHGLSQSDGIGKEPGRDCRRLLMAGGRWDPEQLLSDYRQRELRDFLPAETAQAVQQARQALAETGNGQACDLVLDGTCFRELTRLADAVDCPALTDYLRTRIDGVNLCSAVRAHRLRKAGLSARVLLEAAAFLRQRWRRPPLPICGSCMPPRLCGKPPVWRRASAPEAAGMTALEKQCDNAVLRLAAKARRTPFGVERHCGISLRRKRNSPPSAPS